MKCNFPDCKNKATWVVWSSIAPFGNVTGSTKHKNYICEKCYQIENPNNDRIVYLNKDELRDEVYYMGPMENMKEGIVYTRKYRRRIIK